MTTEWPRTGRKSFPPHECGICGATAAMAWRFLHHRGDGNGRGVTGGDTHGMATEWARGMATKCPRNGRGMLTERTRNVHGTNTRGPAERLHDGVWCGAM